jgi:maltose alpha-D-glucosyltransferase / alpha-amylase
MADFAVGREMYPNLQKLLAPQLPAFLVRQRWFGGKARQIRSADVVDTISLHADGLEAILLVVRVKYADGAEENYAIPVVRKEDANPQADSSALKLEGAGGTGPVVLADALKDERFLKTLLDLIKKQVVVSGEKGELRASQTSAYPRFYPESAGVLKPKPVGAEQSNSSIIYGDRLILKFFRRLEEGLNPDLEVGTFLTETAHFSHIPQLAGALEYHTREGQRMAQGILQAFVPNQGDAWTYTLKSLAEFYAGAAKATAPVLRAQAPTGEEQELPNFASISVGPYLESAALLGQRTAEMHLALSSDLRDQDFAPEPFNAEFQAALEKSMLGLVTRIFGLFGEKRATLPAEWRSKADEVASKEKEIERRVQTSLSAPIDAMRTRIHGDYHLGQVLYTGSDFVIIDFEGEPARSLAERRMKRSPLQDVAGMLRSFHYAAFAPLLTSLGGQPPVGDIAQLGGWADAWNSWVSARFLASYFRTAGEASYLPSSRTETQKLLELHLLEKAVYELGYELNNRPTWVGIPLQGISRLLAA